MSLLSSALPGSQGLLQIPQSVAAALDVDDMCVVQQPVQNGGGQRFVTGQQLAPVAHALVSRDQDRATAIAVGHQPEEQAGLGPVHGLEAQLVDDQQCGIQVLLAPEPGRRQVGVGLERGQQLIEAVELGREALLDGLHAQADGDMCLANPGRALDEQRLGCADPGAGGAR